LWGCRVLLAVGVRAMRAIMRGLTEVEFERL